MPADGRPPVARRDEVEAETLPSPSPAENDGKGADVLVVAEQSERQTHLRRRIEPTYAVECRGTGSEGLTEAQRLRPTLIVAEARMAGMGGIDVCEALSGEQALRGTAVLLLLEEEGPTARTAALRSGADAVLAMPLEPGVLEAQVEALCTQRQQYRRRIVAQEHATDDARSSFVAQAREIIERRLGEDEFGPQDLAEAVALSYVQCYRRLRDELDQTPSQFIRAVRLDRAAALLRQGAESIRTVASVVGFGSASYFSRCFREYVGRTPSAYREEEGSTEVGRC